VIKQKEASVFLAVLLIMAGQIKFEIWTNPYCMDKYILQSICVKARAIKKHCSDFAEKSLLAVI